jgi:glyoxylate/hydroxypyruvate reductase A
MTSNIPRCPLRRKVRALGAVRSPPPHGPERRRARRCHLTTEASPEEVDYIVYAPNSGLTDFTPFTRLKAVLNLWAGVEDVTGNPTLKVPLARMVDDGLTEGMVEWVTGHVLRHHLGMDTHIHGQDGVWRAGSAPPLARDRTVAVLGLGVLGAACAQALAALNFRVLGWSRSPKAIEGVETAHGRMGSTPRYKRRRSSSCSCPTRQPRKTP